MIDKFCNYLTKKIRIKMPDVDDERAEIINYGLQNLIGEIPKTFILLLVAYFLGVFKLAVIAFAVMLPYRMVSGGFHLKTHIGCIVGTSLIYCGNAFLSKYILLDPLYLKFIVIFLVWIFGIAMIKLYAPADTENVPIISKKARILKRNLSYLVLSISLIVALFINDSIISNLIIFGMFLQTITITRFAYNITNNRYGYEVYQE